MVRSNRVLIRIGFCVSVGFLLLVINIFILSAMGNSGGKSTHTKRATPIAKPIPLLTMHLKSPHQSPIALLIPSPVHSSRLGRGHDPYGRELLFHHPGRDLPRRQRRHPLRLRLQLLHLGD
jgi:hypothetical protein